MNVYVFTPCKEKLITDLLIVIVTRKNHVRQAGFCYWKVLYNGLILGARLVIRPRRFKLPLD
jgi:hypothetical protein